MKFSEWPQKYNEILTRKQENQNDDLDADPAKERLIEVADLLNESNSSSSAPSESSLSKDTYEEGSSGEDESLSSSS